MIIYFDCAAVDKQIIDKVDTQFARIIFLVVAMVLWMSWLLGLEMTLLV